ncbi:MAG: sensor histidine kinase, partial [Nitrososphaeraceae archaeon]
IIVYTQEQIRQQTELLETERVVTIKQIAGRTELRINDAVKILQILSNNNYLQDLPSVSLIDKNLHGIPEDADTEKRNVMYDVFNTYGDFQNILLVLANGDVYAMEPYSDQQTLTVSNFAFRDWFQNVTSTHQPYVGTVITSKVNNKPIIPIAVPVFSKNGSFEGVLRASLDPIKIQKKLEELYSYSNERILIIDNNKAVVADSQDLLRINQQISYADNVQQKVFSGDSGHVISFVNGTNMFMVYSPIKIGQNTWTIVSMQPYDDAFRSVNVTIQESFILVTFIVGTSSGSIYVVNRLFQTQFRLRKQVEESNEFLKKTQGIIIESEERYRNLFNLSPDAVTLIDLEAKTLSCNKAFEKLFGYSKDEMVGESGFGLVAERSLPDANKLFSELKNKNYLSNKELWLKKKDGSLFPALFSTSIFRDKNNDIVGYINIIKDVTEIYETRRKIQASEATIKEQLNKLKEVGKTKDEFSSMITHELKTPLVPILGYCKMLKTSLLGKLNEEEAAAIEVIERNAKGLERLIDDVMDVRKLDLDKMKFRFENLPLSEFFDNLDSSYKKILKDRGIEFVIKLSIKDSIIHTDKSRLRQVFNNLISNSMKFVSENNGLIEVGGYKEKDGLILYVKDNGIGIPKEKQSELFKKFYQVDTSEQRKAGGTGLGLAICKGIMERLGGTIWVESYGKTGTTFYLKLPLKE